MAQTREDHRYQTTMRLSIAMKGDATAIAEAHADQIERLYVLGRQSSDTALSVAIDAGLDERVIRRIERQPRYNMPK